MDFLVIALCLHRKSLLHHATHSIIARLRGLSFGSTDFLVYFGYFQKILFILIKKYLTACIQRLTYSFESLYFLISRHPTLPNEKKKEKKKFRANHNERCPNKKATVRVALNMTCASQRKRVTNACKTR